ncbi:MAG TPA: type II secretion system protein [Gudongella oleilytica]|nr:type II secretion system protein [Gudongella oleilytica]
MNWFNRKAEKKRGFTIVELIISVGTLAMAGTIMIQLFMGAKDVALRAKELDRSVFLSTRIIESIKSEQWDEEPLNKMYTEYAMRYGNKLKKTGYYNEEWEEVEEGSEDILFVSTLSMESKDIVEEDKSLYELALQIRRLKPYFKGSEAEPILNSVETMVYIRTPLEVIEP